MYAAAKAFASKAALTTPNDVPISFYSANLDFTESKFSIK